MSKSKKTIQLRPHHLMCVHGFKGKGYSPEYVKNFWKIVETIQDEDVCVEVVAGPDSICKPCPNLDGKVCTPRGVVDEPRIQELDVAYMNTLNLHGGEQLTWKEIIGKISSTVTEEIFDKNCAPCSWKRLGYCKEALMKIRNLSFMIVFASLLCLSRTSFAKRRPASEDLFPVEKITEKLNADKTKKIPAFSKILKAKAQKKYVLMKSEASALESQAEFKDYYFYLSGEAEYLRAHQMRDLGNFSGAETHYQTAIMLFSNAVSANVYSPLQKKSDIYRALASLELGKILAKRKSKQKSRSALENGFQILSDRNVLVLAQKSVLEAYAKVCDAKPDELCTSWEFKLSGLLPKADRARVFPRLSKLAFASADRTTSVPYKADLDLQAFDLGFEAYLSQKYEDAFGIWEQLLKDYPRTSIKLRTKFWMARAAQKASQDATAETLYREVIKDIPFSYYAMMSSWYSGIDVFRGIDATLPMAQSNVQLSQPEDHIHVKRAEVLLANGAKELAKLELREVRPSLTMPNEFLVYLAGLNQLAENYVGSFQIISELGSRGYTSFISSFGERMIFPQVKIEGLDKYSKQYELDPMIVTSLIKQESAFNAEAISTSGAFGLMQIITPTARDLDADIEPISLFDEEKNVSLGTKYVRQLLKRYQGDIIYTLAGYNAGPGNADRWKAAAIGRGPLLPDEMIELITFRETHDYVENILRNYYWYKRRSTGEGFVNFGALLQSIH